MAKFSSLVSTLLVFAYFKVILGSIHWFYNGKRKSGRKNGRGKGREGEGGRKGLLLSKLLREVNQAVQSGALPCPSFLSHTFSQSCTTVMFQRKRSSQSTVLFPTPETLHMLCPAWNPFAGLVVPGGPSELNSHVRSPRLASDASFPGFS